MTESTLGSGTRMLGNLEAHRGMFEYLIEDRMRVPKYVDYLCQGDPKILEEFGTKEVLRSYIESILNGASQFV